MSSPADSKKRLALAIINFLTTSTTDGTLSADETESIEVATQCIADAFKVDPSDSAAMNDALGGQSLHAIYSVFERMKGNKPAASSSAPKTSSSTPSSAAQKSSASAPSDADKARAESLKGQGNTAMQKKDFKSAVDFYTRALEIIPNNAIFLSNRAAAYSNLGDYTNAIKDASLAVDTDPSYTKAWSRLGLARFGTGDARGAMEAYKAGIEAEGNGGSEIMKRGYETARKRVEEEEAAGDNGGADSPPAARSASPRAGGPGAGGMPDLSSLAGMLGGMGGGGGGQGGMPDLGSIMQNPMFAQMAQNLMSNPGMMQGLMNNPKLKEMMEGAGGGGGMPDLGSLMSDPSIAEMAKNLMGGGGAGGSGGAGRGAGGSP